MPLRLLNDAKHWQDRAEEARIQAEQMMNPETKHMMRGIADSYAKLAKRAEERQLAAEGGKAAT